jgi:methylphosphotriester-DNA--protein-cysteine methyltransferase
MQHLVTIQEIEKLLEIHDLPQETKEHVALSLAENILKRTMIEIVRILSEEEAVTFNQLAEEGKIEEALALLSTTHPEIDEVVKKVGEDVLEEFSESFHR